MEGRYVTIDANLDYLKGKKEFSVGICSFGLMGTQYERDTAEIIPEIL